jgi:hypothetical protein
MAAAKKQQSAAHAPESLRSTACHASVTWWAPEWNDIPCAVNLQKTNEPERKTGT